MLVQVEHCESVQRISVTSFAAYVISKTLVNQCMNCMKLKQGYVRTS